VQIFDDLDTELARIDGILDGLSEEQWLAASGAPPWTVADVVLHLAQTNEFVVASCSGGERGTRIDLAGPSVDAVMDTLVERDRAPYDEVFARWRASVADSSSALRAADAGRPLQWVAAPLKPASLATTRLAEHWAHALDITGPLDIQYDDTDRLRHIAWLAHRSLPYAFAVAFPGTDVPSVYAELTGPDADTWCFGAPGADVTVTGPAGDWCRLGAQRLSPDQTTLMTTGDRGADVLRAVRNYAA
jgi:uncharacterized protein (TIGR03084 family)